MTDTTHGAEGAMAYEEEMYPHEHQAPGDHLAVSFHRSADPHGVGFVVAGPPAMT